MSRLRHEGVASRHARRSRLQQQQRATGRPRRAGGQNFWVSKGPAPVVLRWLELRQHCRSRLGRRDGLGQRYVLYVGAASGGVWKSTDQGQSYVSIFDDAGTMTVGAIAIDPNDANVIWVGTGENNRGCESYFGIGLLRSADGGTELGVAQRHGQPTRSRTSPRSPTC